MNCTSATGLAAAYVSTEDQSHPALSALNSLEMLEFSCLNLMITPQISEITPFM